MDERLGRYVVKVEQKDRFRWGPIQITWGGDFECRITCPPGTDLDLAGGSTDLRADGELGEVSVRTASGDMRLESALRELQVKTASGDIAVGTLAAQASLVTVSGDLGVERVEAPLTARAVSGDVTIGRVVRRTRDSRPRPVTSTSRLCRAATCACRPCPVTSASVSHVERARGSTPRRSRGVSSPSSGSRIRSPPADEGGAVRPAARQDGQRRRLDRARGCGVLRSSLPRVLLRRPRRRGPRGGGRRADVRRSRSPSGVVSTS